MADAIEILDIREAGEDGGDLMGFYAKGHHEVWRFAEACNLHNNVDSFYDRRHVRPKDVRHVWWRNTPIAGQPGFWMFNTAEPGSRGAYAVTVWDGLETANLETSRRVVREYHRGKCTGMAEGVNWALRYVEAAHGREACEAMLEAFRDQREKLEGLPA